MPAIRAIALALPLLVARVLADHMHDAVTANDLALLAHRLDRRSYLHGPFRMDPYGSALAADRLPLPPADYARTSPGQLTRARPRILPSAGSSPSARCHGVSTRGPSAVIATVNSKCAVSDPSCE